MVVLDAWALLAYLRDEPASERIEAEWLSDGAARAEMRTIRRRAEVVEADWELIRAAAEIKAGGGLSYADAFCLATAQRLDAALWTGDPEIVARARRSSAARRWI